MAIKLLGHVWHVIRYTTEYRGHRRRDRMVVGFTYATSAYHHWCCWFESQSGQGVQHYVIKFVSDLRQISSFLLFPPPIKLTATIQDEPFTYDTPALRQTGSRNLMDPKTLPMIWGTYMKLVTKYQISAINSCWEKCAYMFNVYKYQLSRQTGSRNLTGPKTLPTIW